MSKIQAIFNGTGRELRDKERSSMDAFVARYEGVLTTPPGMVRTVSEKPKSRQVGVNGQFVEAIIDTGTLKTRVKMIDRRKKTARTAKSKPFKMAILKATGL